MTNNPRSLKRIAVILLILQGLLIFVSLIILDAAINWPASLSEPASINPPLLIEQASAVRLGYSVYLIYSILFWPVALLTARATAGSDTFPSGLKIAAGFGVASMVARCIGIVRWLRLAVLILGERCIVEPSLKGT